MPDDPNDGGERDREQQTEKRAGKRDDDFVERRNSRQGRAIHVRPALDDVHRRELRGFQNPAEWQRAERVEHAVDLLFPERFAEPDAELLDHQSAPPRGEKVPELMDNDEQIKKDNDLEQDEEDATGVQDHRDISGKQESRIEHLKNS